jgi:hypothetical protein
VTVATPWVLVPGWPTRFEAFARPGVWCALDVDWSTVPAPAGGRLVDVRWLEMAVYSCPAAKLHAEVRRHPTPLKGKEYVAEVYRDGRGDSLLAADFPEAVALASEWLGLS